MSSVTQLVDSPDSQFSLHCNCWCPTGLFPKACLISQLLWAFSSSNCYGYVDTYQIYMLRIQLPLKLQASKYNCMWDFFSCQRTSKSVCFSFIMRSFSSNLPFQSIWNHHYQLSNGTDRKLLNRTIKSRTTFDSLLYLNTQSIHLSCFFGFLYVFLVL